MDSKEMAAVKVKTKTKKKEMAAVKAKTKTRKADRIPVGLVTLLTKASRQELEDVIKCLNPKGRQMLSKCAYNAVYNPAVPQFKRDEIRRRLHKKAKDIELLANSGESDERRRRVLEKKGGFLLPLLLSVVVPLLTSFIESQVSKS
jgi:hypothetical protein